MEEDKFDKFWERVWKSVFHSLGILAVIGFPALLIWGFVEKSKSPGTHYMSTVERDTIRQNFRRFLFASGKPCAIKTKTYSDISACDFFGIRLGQDYSETKQTINGSGYLDTLVDLGERCGSDKKDCVKFLYGNNGQFSIRADLAPDMKVSSITAIFDIFDSPYIEPETLRAKFLKIFGPPDETTGWDTWGDMSATFIRAYFNSGKYWVVIEKLKKQEKEDDKSRPPA